MHPADSGWQGGQIAVPGAQVTDLGEVAQQAPGVGGKTRVVEVERRHLVQVFSNVWLFLQVCPPTIKQRAHQIGRQVQRVAGFGVNVTFTECLAFAFEAFNKSFLNEAAAFEPEVIPIAVGITSGSKAAASFKNDL